MRSNGYTPALVRPKYPLSICVSIGYTPAMAGKDSGLRIRVERPLREAFLDACRMEDRPAAQVIREFMRNYVARHGANIDAASPSRQENRSQHHGRHPKA
jgi:hypothetical protein